MGLLPALMWAGTEPRAAAKDYPVHISAGRAEIGAEYLSRTINDANSSYYTGVYLVIEVAIYPDKGVTLPVAASDFQLRVNGRKTPLLAQTPGMVAVAIRNPDWEGRRTGVVAGGGLGNADIIIGGRTPTARFPGDTRDTRRPQPVPPPDGNQQRAQQDGGEAAIRLALQELRAEGAVSGLIYFAHKSKLNDIRRLELIYEGPAGRQVLVLR